jgi:hypothetical protein
LADVEDIPTRRASGGALAMLTDFEEVCRAIEEIERGVERICGMVGDDDNDVAFRGIICVKNLLENGGDLKKRIVESGTSDKIQKMMKQTSNDGIKRLCDEISKRIA